jgi:hypothetical protein
MPRQRAGVFMEKAMGFVQREIDRIRQAILADPPNRAELYAAQQALEWAMEPSGIASPYDMIMGTAAGSEDCSVHNHLPSSLDTSGH